MPKPKHLGGALSQAAAEWRNLGALRRLQRNQRLLCLRERIVDPNEPILSSRWKPTGSGIKLQPDLFELRPASFR